MISFGEMNLAIWAVHLPFCYTRVVFYLVKKHHDDHLNNFALSSQPYSEMYVGFLE